MINPDTPMNEQPQNDHEPEPTLDAQNPEESTPALGETAWLERAEQLTESALAFGKNVTHKIRTDINPKQLATGVVGMTAGEGIGSAVGGVIGSVGGPIGTVIGAQLGSMAGGSMGAKYGYEWRNKMETDASIDSENIGQDAACSETPSSLDKTLTNQSAHLMGESLGKQAGTALGQTIGGPTTSQIMGTLGETLGGAMGDESVKPTENIDEANGYRKAPTRAWLKRIAKTKLTETALSGILGGVGQWVLGPIGGRIGSKAGAIASSHLDWSKENEPEFIDLDSKESQEKNASTVESLDQEKKAN